MSTNISSLAPAAPMSFDNLGKVSTGNLGLPPRKEWFAGTKDFLDSNSLVAKVAFLLLLVIVFVVLLRLGSNLLGYLFGPNRDPMLIKGTVDATQMRVIPQNPAKANAKPIYRSVNQAEGIEFTWSVWLYLKNLAPMSDYKHIFHKGNDAIDYSGQHGPVGMNFPNNAPGLYIAPRTNNLVLVMNTFNKINEEIVVEDIPLNKWLNVMIRVEDMRVDVYVNGTVVKSHKLSGVPKQNYGDVYVAMNGGFNGYISNLRYWDYALGIYKIQNIIADGPDLEMKDKDMLDSEPKYFSLRWFFADNQATQMDYGGL